jgi:hypothetical protein
LCDCAHVRVVGSAPRACFVRLEQVSGARHRRRPGHAKGKCRPSAGRVEVCNGNYGDNGWLGFAQIWINSDHITQGAAKMNDTYLGSVYSTTNKQHVICQEVGHTSGHGHQDESPPVAATG